MWFAENLSSFTSNTDIHFCTKREAEESSKVRSHAPMRSFKESEKSQKTVKSMIETKGGDRAKEPGGKKNKNTKKEGEQCSWMANFKHLACLLYDDWMIKFYFIYIF